MTIQEGKHNISHLHTSPREASYCFILKTSIYANNSLQLQLGGPSHFQLFTELYKHFTPPLQGDDNPPQPHGGHPHCHF